jgi:hypothetical protein
MKLNITPYSGIYNFLKNTNNHNNGKQHYISIKLKSKHIFAYVLNGKTSIHHHHIELGNLIHLKNSYYLQNTCMCPTNAGRWTT